MSTTYTEVADKSTVTATGEAPPYTPEEAFNYGKVDWDGLVNAVDDTAAAAAGVAVGTVYRNGSVVQVRVA